MYLKSQKNNESMRVKLMRFLMIMFLVDVAEVAYET